LTLTTVSVRLPLGSETVTASPGETAEKGDGQW